MKTLPPGCASIPVSADLSDAALADAIGVAKAQARAAVLHCSEENFDAALWCSTHICDQPPITVVVDPSLPPWGWYVYVAGCAGSKGP